jgi:hypothetical protein
MENVIKVLTMTPEGNKSLGDLRITGHNFNGRYRVSDREFEIRGIKVLYKGGTYEIKSAGSDFYYVYIPS